MLKFDVIFDVCGVKFTEINKSCLWMKIQLHSKVLLDVYLVLEANKGILTVNPELNCLVDLSIFIS